MMASAPGDFQCLRQRVAQQVKIGGAAAADPDASVLRRREGHPDEDALIHQRRQHGLRELAVAPAVEGDEVGGRGQGREPVLRRDGGDAGPGLLDLAADMGQPVGILERRQRPRLRDPADAEVVADLVEGADQLGRADTIATRALARP